MYTCKQYESEKKNAESLYKDEMESEDDFIALDMETIIKKIWLKVPWKFPIGNLHLMT